MFAVTACTVLASHLRVGVVTPVLVDEILNFRMTGEAFEVFNLFTENVALSTVAQPLKVCVRCRKRTWRYLSKCTSGHERNQKYCGYISE